MFLYLIFKVFYNFFLNLQHERLGKKRLGDVINSPALDPTDPFAGDEDAALKALAKQFENRYVSIILFKNIRM